MATLSPEAQAVLGMAAETVGKDLLSALVTEIKLMPDVWPKLSQFKQQDVIDRLRSRVETNVRMAVHLIASEGRSTVVGDLESVAIKDGIKATFIVSKGNESRHDLFDAVGKACLLIVADVRDFTAGMGDVKGEPDQRAMDGLEPDDGGAGDGAPLALTFDENGKPEEE